MKTPLFLFLAALAGGTFTSCQSLAPGERAALLDAGLRIAEARLLAGHAK